MVTLESILRPSPMEKGGAPMLRIVVNQEGADVRLGLHGRLAGDWVRVLERCWESLQDSVPHAVITAELVDITFVDPDGERLLARMHEVGVSLQATGCRNRHLVDQIRTRTPRSTSFLPRTHTS